MQSAQLSVEKVKYTQLKEQILSSWPDLDEETLRDTLEGITDLHEMIGAVIRSALVDEALQSGLRTRLEEMRRRLTRLEERGAKKRQLALDAMSEVGTQEARTTGLHRLGAIWIPWRRCHLRRHNPIGFLAAATT